jgi:putative oxidoreductase
MDVLDYVLLALRLWLGIVIIAHGIGHARNVDGTAEWFASKGFRPARPIARMSGLGELAIGAGLVLGLLTGPAAAGLIVTMTVAFWAVHRPAGFFVYARPDEGWEYVATLVVMASAVAVLGPGAVSLDAVLGIDGVLDGWIGLLLVAGGIAAGAAQLALTWRAPDPD